MAGKWTKLSVEELEKEVSHHNKLYFVDHAPEISDQEFDRLVHFAREVGVHTTIVQFLSFGTPPFLHTDLEVVKGFAYAADGQKSKYNSRSYTHGQQDQPDDGQLQGLALPHGQFDGPVVIEGKI